MSFRVSEIAALTNLLTPANEESDSDEDQPQLGSSKFGPGHIGESKKQRNSASKKDINQSKEIWCSEEITEGAEFDSLSDPRLQPEYDIIYNQSVTTEDIFLQLGNKTPNTSSCEKMVVKINLPNTEMKDITLDIKSIFLDLRTPKYKLGLHLPHPVDEQQSKAEWDASQHSLIVCMKMNREYDFCNY